MDWKEHCSAMESITCGSSLYPMKDAIISTALGRSFFMSSYLRKRMLSESEEDQVRHDIMLLECVSLYMHSIDLSGTKKLRTKPRETRLVYTMM